MPYCPVCDKDFKTCQCPVCGNTMLPRATAGFGVSLAAGAVLMITAIITLLFWIPISAIIFFFLPWLAFLGFIIQIIGLISAIIVIVGAALIYLPGKEYAGAVLVLLFSIVSIVILGGFIVGITLGITGAALGFAKK